MEKSRKLSSKAGASADLYSRSGVDQRAADGLTQWIARASRQVRGPGVVSGICQGDKGFAGMYEVPGTPGKLLVACTDGVGTKLKLAFQLKRHDTVGIDLVAMSVNDLVTTGARPLFFLDYMAVGKLKEGVAKEILKGVIAGCREADCALLGGETAQLPDFYQKGEYDLAGFAVGFVERKNAYGPGSPAGARTVPGDVLLGLASNGLHSNGFSLVRRIVEKRSVGLGRRIPGLKGTLGEELLRPTRIYARQVMRLVQDPKTRRAVRAMAHITGGGIPGNVPRMLPAGVGAVVDKSAWPRPAVFGLVREWGRVSEREMYEVFNMGIGLVVAVDRRREAECREILGGSGVYRVGEIVRGPRRISWA